MKMNWPEPGYAIIVKRSTWKTKAMRKLKNGREQTVMGHDGVAKKIAREYLYKMARAKRGRYMGVFRGPAKPQHAYRKVI